MTRILLADDRPTFVDGLCTQFDRTPDLDLVAVAGTRDELVDMLGAADPDVVVLGIAYDLVPRAAAIAAVLVLGAAAREQDAAAALSAGAVGYVTREAGPTDIVTAIRVVSRGGRFITIPDSRTW